MSSLRIIISIVLILVSGVLLIWIDRTAAYAAALTMSAFSPTNSGLGWRTDAELGASIHKEYGHRISAMPLRRAAVSSNGKIKIRTAGAFVTLGSAP